MGMTKCKECGTEVSSKAKACPQCGADPRSWWYRRNPLSKILIIFFGLAILAGMFGGGEDSSTSSTGQLVTGDPQTLLLNIRDFDEAGWKVKEEGNNSITFLKAGGFSVEKLKETIIIYPSVDEAMRAYNSEVPQDISIESMNVGDESAMWEESGGFRGIGVFRVRNVVVTMEYYVSYAAGATISLESWARKAARKIG